MREFKWEKVVTANQLGAFVEIYTDYRLTIILPCIKSYARDTFTGSSYVLETKEGKNELTPNCRKKTLYLVWDATTKHFGATNSASNPYVTAKNSTKHVFCHRCISIVEGICSCTKPPEKPLIKTIKTCVFCKRTPCMKTGCSRNCQICGVNFKVGYDPKKGQGHRCIVFHSGRVETFLKHGDPEPKPSKNAPYKLWAYDIEATTTITNIKSSEFRKENNEFLESNGEFEVFERYLELQKTNMVVFRDIFDPNSEQVLFGENSLREFIVFMLNHNGGKNICIAHNGSGYDTRLICEEISTLGVNVKTSSLSSGTKIMELRANDTIFRDSLLHLPGSLSNLASAFGLTLKKGTFPHLFNKPENYSYDGQIPDKKYFDLTFTAKNQKDIDAFDKWYMERSNDVWNFRNELASYCRDDVKILAELMQKHDEICVQKFGFSPWFSATAPSYCHKVIKSQISNEDILKLPDDDNDRRSQRIHELAWDEHWGILLPQEYWHARRALIGGRTDVRRIHFRLSDDDIQQNRSIKYQDIVSMYPYVQARKDLLYPVGLPRIKVYDDKYFPCSKHQSPIEGNKLKICDCSRFEKFADRMIDVEEISIQPTFEYMMDFNTFGIATVSLIPPTNLFHPVLVIWDEFTGKRISTLEPIIEQTFTMIEIQLALSKGYVITKVHRIDLYNKAPALWSDFVKDLYIEKMVNSETTPSESEQEKLIDAYEHDFGIGNKVKESFPRWDFRPALRMVFKIMLNSGWGKHCQRPNMSMLNFIHEDDTTAMTKLFSNVDNDNLSITNITIQGDKTIYHTKPRKFNPLSHDNYLPAGLFVPAYGRIMLYEALDVIDDRVLYHDTDSIIYIHDPLKENIEEGDIWGEWSEEKVSKNNNIVAFVGLGAKSYALETRDGKDIIKLKGISVRKSHKINFKMLEEMVLCPNSEGRQSYIPQRNFKYCLGTGITIIESLKKFGFSVDELKGFLHGTKVYPPGYCRDCLLGHIHI